jgi:ankyrin repeat protein
VLIGIYRSPEAFLCRDGKTALMFSAELGHDSTVGLLLEHHADVNAADE